MNAMKQIRESKEPRRVHFGSIPGKEIVAQKRMNWRENNSTMGNKIREMSLTFSCITIPKVSC